MKKQSKRGILFKITATILCVSVISLVVISILSLATIQLIENTSLQSSMELGERSAQDSAAALEEKSTEQLLIQAQSLADIADEKLHVIANDTFMIASAASEVFANPLAYTKGVIHPPLKENLGKRAVMYVCSEGITEPIEEELAYAANITDMLYQISDKNEAIISSYLGFDTGLYVLADITAETLFERTKFDPRERTWYKLAASKKNTVFSDVYEDSEGRGLALTCAAPFYQNDTLKGVAGCGVMLTDITNLITNVEIGKTGYAFVLNEVGEVIISKNITEDEEGNIIREDMANSSNLQIKEIADKMINAQTGVEQITMDGKDVYIAYAPMDSTHWSIATVIEVEEVLQASRDSQANIESLTNRSAIRISEAVISAILLLLIIVAISLVVVYVVSRKIAEKITHPIIALNEGVKQISDGKLNTYIDIRTNDEIQDLGNAFNKMTVNLIEQMSNLRKVTAEKERIGAELNVATQIQTSMLPCIFPAFPDRPEFDVYATMHAAKEVGGDFYDFFLIDQTHLAVVMADVSGKGVPAALFMVIAKTLIKNYAQLNAPPCEVFELTNEQLCETNDAGMFVTAFMGVLEIATGKFVYVNAGHNPPLLAPAGEPFEWLELKPGFVLAGMEGMTYEQQEITLNPGDQIFLYTDGVTEALNKENELYSDPRLIEFFNSGVLEDKTVDEILELVRVDIADFADGAEQADDITMLLLKISERGGENG